MNRIIIACSCHRQSVNKSYANIHALCHYIIACSHLAVAQIIEEQLTFPSGTATAQLISVLHKLPPPDTGVHKRRGYTALESEDVADATREEGVDVEADREGDEQDEEVKEVVSNEGWSALGWSFVASAALTVRPPTLTPSH